MSPPPLRHWLLGLVLSLAVVWAAGALFLDTVQPVARDPAVGRFMPEPGTVMRQRSEGWARTTAGEHGLRSLPGGRLPPGPKVVFWGDSYVEALQVDDAGHMDQVFTRLARRAGLDLAGVGLGVSGDGVLDDLFRLRPYASVFAPVVLHVFVVAEIDEFLPDVPHPGHGEFRSAPEPHLVFDTAVYGTSHLRFGHLVRSLELAGPYRILRKALALDLRLAPGPARPEAQPAPAAQEPERQARLLDFLLTTLRSQAPEPLLVAHIPYLPRLRGGVVHDEDPDAPAAAAVRAACQRNGVDFLDLGPEFRSFRQVTGRFPRGFLNSPPGQGHLNQDGHRLVAEAVLRYVRERRDALLAR